MLIKMVDQEKRIWVLLKYVSDKSHRPYNICMKKWIWSMETSSQRIYSYSLGGILNWQTSDTVLKRSHSKIKIIFLTFIMKDLSSTILQKLSNALRVKILIHPQSISALLMYSLSASPSSNSYSNNSPSNMITKYIYNYTQIHPI